MSRSVQYAYGSKNVLKLHMQNATTAINSEWKYEILAVVAHVP